MTAAKSLAIRLALASPGSARTVNSFGATVCVCGSGASASAGLASAALAPWRAYLAQAASPGPMPQNSFAIFIDGMGVRHHAVRDLRRFGRQIPPRQQHRESEPGGRADGAAPRPPPKLPETKTQKYRAPALTRSARHRLRPWPANATSSRQSRQSLPCGIAGKMAELRRRLWRVYDASATASSAASSSASPIGASVGPSR